MAGRHASGPEGPVFVDPSGRRSAGVRVVGWVVAALVVGYLLLVAVALVGPPGLSRVTVPGLGPVLPGPGAARLDGGQPSREEPGAVLERTPSPFRSASPSPSPARTSAPPTSTATSSPRPTPTPVPTSGPPSPTGPPSASPTSRRTGPSTPQPTRSEPPGASRRPTRPPG